MDTFVIIKDFVMANGFDILAALSMIVAGASVLANFTRTDVDNRVLATISNVINKLALNFRK